MLGEIGNTQGKKKVEENDGRVLIRQVTKAAVCQVTYLINHVDHRTCSMGESSDT